MGDVTEAEAQLYKFILMHIYLAVGVKLCKYPPVFLQVVVDTLHQCRRITVKPVVIIVPALVVAELLISPAQKSLAAVEANFFHNTSPQPSPQGEGV